MCLSSTEQGGPRRCSGDARNAYLAAAAAVSCLERTESTLAQRTAPDAEAPRGGRGKRPALSPSRAADFKRCPLLYRLRAIDRIPEPPSPAAVRGSVVHAVLEDLYRLPAEQRTPQKAQRLLGRAWERVAASTAGAAEFSGDEVTALIDEAGVMLSRYFQLEDPRRFSPAAVEHRIDLHLPDGTPLRGFIDRVDVAETGAIRIVDYKTGKTPPEGSPETARAGRRPDPVAADFPRRRPGSGPLPRQRRTRPLRTVAVSVVAGYSSGDRQWSFPASPVAVVRRLRPPVAVPGIRRHPSPIPAATPTVTN